MRFIKFKMKRKNISYLFLMSLEILLGGIFVYSGFGKIVFHYKFEMILLNYKLLPFVLVKPMSYFIPWVEVVFGTFFVFGVRIRIIRIVLSGLLCIFILALFINLIRGINTECGCFVQNNYQESNRNDMIFAIGRDLVLLILFAIHYFIIRKRGIWFRVRNQVQPCRTCVYEVLCPPLSNYEYALHRNNLCHIHVAKKKYNDHDLC